MTKGNLAKKKGASEEFRISIVKRVEENIYEGCQKLNQARR